jgi:hypothetical protein
MEEFKSSNLVNNLENVLYVIFQYNFNQNLYELLDNIYMFVFSFCSLSHRNIFKLFLQYKEN